ncbi:MAG: response regulator [Rhizobiaceae bacterium]|nr:MAG: response regulator [Rhizobiaceae bacterium]
MPTEWRPILIVEDDARDIDLIEIAFERLGVANDRYIVRDGEEALQFLRYEGFFANRPRAEPTLILLDLKMPRLTGIELLQEIRRDSALRNLRVAIFSSSNEAVNVAVAHASGIEAFVVKPTVFNDVTASIASLGRFFAFDD